MFGLKIGLQVLSQSVIRRIHIVSLQFVPEISHSLISNFGELKSDSKSVHIWRATWKKITTAAHTNIEQTSRQLIFSQQTLWLWIRFNNTSHKKRAQFSIEIGVSCLIPKLKIATKPTTLKITFERNELKNTHKHTFNLTASDC